VFVPDNHIQPSVTFAIEAGIYLRGRPEPEFTQR